MQKDLLSNLTDLIRKRLHQHFEIKAANPITVSLNSSASFLNRVVRQFIPNDNLKLSQEEMIVLTLGSAPHIEPGFLDEIIGESLPKAGDFPQLGGARGKQFRGFLPTGQTALFLLAGNDLDKQLKMQELFQEDHFFAKNRILWLEPVAYGEPRMSGRIILSPDFIDLLTIGHITRPRFSMEFPAQYLETEMEWEDLVLNESTLQQIHELETWVKHGQTLLMDWGMKKRLKPGYRALFYGPPGTGKTLTASLLGKYTQRDVYRVDLSMVVSKYIGETEKNLSNLFTKAENKNWILFFDEADALFGKRTNVRDAHDKYANQEVSYLLQRVEAYNGLVILASNFKSNIDDAFMRRFQSIIQFPMPKAGERLVIWSKAFPENITLEKGLDISSIARTYELSGASIMNVVQYCCLEALNRGDEIILKNDILKATKKEILKEGKIVN